jgi:hypothetical protein
MATVDIKAEFKLILDASEMRLVRAALAGKLKPEDVADAKTLGDEIAKRQANATDTYLKGNAKLLSNIEKAGG